MNTDERANRHTWIITPNNLVAVNMAVIAGAWTREPRKYTRQVERQIKLRGRFVKDNYSGRQNRATNKEH